MGVDALHHGAVLEEIGYLVPEGPAFEIETQNTDPEFASVPGPQLVVPVLNARLRSPICSAALPAR